MNRRGLLRGVAVAGTLGVAGCLDRLGFDEQSAWANPPLVEDRPDAVYLPAGSEEMGEYGRTAEGDYGFGAGYTIPHRFWIPGSGGSMVDVDTDDSLHLMLVVWDRETDTVLPADMDLEIRRDGDPVGNVARSPWPMLSQRMGFHYGDNVSLPGEGKYTLQVRVGPVDTRKTGAFADRLDEPATLTVDFEYAESDIHDIDVDPIAEDRRGDPGALPLMDHGNHDTDDHGADHDHEIGPPPLSRGPPIDDLPGDVLGTERSADAAITAVLTDDDRATDTDEDAYLAVCPRTPYNDVILPFMSLSATIEREEANTAQLRLTETLDDAFGHHYGVGVPPLETGDELTVSIDTPPQASRHDGYETAFFDFDDVSYTV